jgi:hypothetical protein
VNNIATPNNTQLSAEDKSFVGRVDMYPFPGGDGVGPRIVALSVMEDLAIDGEIGKPGAEDLYKFNATSSGNYTIENGGANGCDDATVWPGQSHCASGGG